MGTQWGPSRTAAPPHVCPMPIVAKRSPISATAELLFDNEFIVTSSLVVRRVDDFENEDKTLVGLLGEAGKLGPGQV